MAPRAACPRRRGSVDREGMPALSWIYEPDMTMTITVTATTTVTVTMTVAMTMLVMIIIMRVFSSLCVDLQTYDKYSVSYVICAWESYNKQ